MRLRAVTITIIVLILALVAESILFYLYASGQIKPKAATTDIPAPASGDARLDLLTENGIDGRFEYPKVVVWGNALMLDQPPLGWEFAPVSTTQKYLELGHSYDKSLGTRHFLSIVVGKSQKIELRSKSIPLESSTKYLLSFSAYTPLSKTLNCKVAYTFWDSSTGKKLSDYNFILTTGEWKTYSKAFVPPVGVKSLGVKSHLTLHLYCSGSSTDIATAYFDQIMLVDAAATTPQPPYY